VDCSVDFDHQVRAGAESVTPDGLSRHLTLQRHIVDLQNYASVPLVGRCFADVARCPQPADQTVSFNSELD